MLINSLHLQNFCQHRDLTLHMTPGLNMLVGPNGSGKTNVLRALQLILIGDAGGDRAKSDDIRQGIGSDDESYVEAELSHSGAAMAIRRSLRPASNLLTIGDDEWRSVGEINAELWRRLGATKKQISDYIFVRQRKIDEMFDQRPADRAASLAALFGVGHAEKVHKKMGEFLNAIEVPTTAIREDDVNAKIKDRRASIKDLNTQILDLDMPKGDVQVFIDFQQLIIDEFRVVQEADQELTRLTDTIGQKDADLVEALRPIGNLDESIADLTTGIAAIAAECERAKGGLDQWQSYRASIKTRDALAADLAAFTERWKDLDSPTPREDKRLTAAEDQVLQEGLARRGDIKVSLLDMKESDVCRTCGQKLPGADDRVSRTTSLEDELRKLGYGITPLLERRDGWKAYDVDFSSYADKAAAATSEKMQLAVREEALKTLDPPTTSEEQLTAVISERDDFLRIVATLKINRGNKAMCLSVLEGELKQLMTQQKATSTKRAQMQTHTMDEYNTAVCSRDGVRKKQQTLIQLQRLLAVVDAELAATEQQLADVQSVKLKGQHTREVVEHLTSVRNIFHRTEAPRMVSYTYVETMLDEVNQTLELFEAPFRVEMDESLGFTARFLDGIRVQPDRCLSVGERIVLAMAFRITVNSTFAGQVGVLIMDEPTAGLDEHNLGSLPKALERLRDLSHERGLQVLFVTHESRISHYFDNTIELPAA